jgi:FKBP-type peptidyl-prolyl cis-trans isomerase
MQSVKVQRIVCLVLAVLFLLSTIGGIAYYVLAIEDQQNQQAAITKEVNNEVKLNNQKSTKLQGTKLEDYQPISNVTALQTIDLKAGTGAAVKSSDTITVNYTGAIASTGVIFQSSLDTGQPATLQLSQVISGWTQGIPGMKVGGTRRLIIPAALAYGSNPTQGSSIPANAALVFDVQLIKIGK